MIIRRKHTANFTTIGNVLFNDERLQADEVGIIGYLLSRPHDWEVRRPALAKRFRYGRKAIKRVIWNGMRFGWIVAQKTKLADGRFYTVYEVRDEPGPDLSDDEIRIALSLVSSEADDEDEESEGGVDGEPSGADPPTPEGGVPERGVPKGYVDSKEESTKYGFDKGQNTPKGARDFADVRTVWPPECILSDSASQAAFLGLSDKDAQACFEGVRPYLDDCRGQNRKVCDLKTYIQERRWERFTGKAAAAAKSALFRVKTPNWYRWREYKIATGQSVKFMDAYAANNPQGMWAEPAEWPPPVPQSKDDSLSHEDLKALQQG